MKMKHFVLGLVFNQSLSTVLLVHKRRPDWQKGMLNGIGGKIKIDETPLQAMKRESKEETGFPRTWFHTITFTCPGGTVYVFRSIHASEIIPFKQVEDEFLMRFNIDTLPDNLMANLKWMIPLSLSSVQFPIMLQQNELGVS